MNYSSHNLRTNLQEWKNRLYRANHNQLGHQLKYFFDNIQNNRQVHALIESVINKFQYNEDDLERFMKSRRLIDDHKFHSFEDQAAFCYQFLQYLFHKGLKSYDLHHYALTSANGFDGRKSAIIEDYISPIIYYLHDKLDRTNSIIFLLEKYKKRTEWFTKKTLFNAYKSVEKNYEQLLEDDLRMFLFDQGIDYPFSTPLSTSGRADIIGEIETDDPLIIEIKIFDRAKKYGKDRIKEGFTQVVKYANDYNKDVGYLVIFNMDEVEINFKSSDSEKVFPPSIIFNGKTFYFVVVNCALIESASKLGTLKEIEITMDELTRK